MKNIVWTGAAPRRCRAALCAVCLTTAAVPALAQTTSPAEVDDQITTAVPATPVNTTSALAPVDASSAQGLVIPAMPTWGSLFSETARDFRRLPSRDTFKWLTIGAVTAIASRPADSGVTRVLGGSTALEEPLESGAIIGGTPFQVGAALATFAIGRATGSPRAAALGADLFRAQILAEGTTEALKFSFRRVRPDGDSSSYSFPSGHTSVTFASATVLQQHFGWKVGIPAYAVASYVAASRIQMKRHYFSDVAFGAALGIVAGRTVTVGRGSARFALAPMAAPGGAGVAFNWVGKQ